jgi:hypothetical protein
MKKTFILLMAATSAMSAQKIDYGLSASYGALLPKIQYQQTRVMDYASSKSIDIADYKKTLKKVIISPSFGLSAELYYPSFPAYCRAELATSKSAIQYLSASAEIGFGDDFALQDNYNFVTLKIGYKLLYDRGFGKATIINSVKTTNEQTALMPYLKRKEFDTQTAKIIPIKAGIGHDFDGLKVGALIQLDIDVSSIVSIAKMNSVSIGIYVKRCQSLTSRKYKNDL